LKEQNFEEARAMALQVTALGIPGADTEDIFEAHLVLARVYETLGQSPERLSELRIALSLKPGHEATAIETGRLLINGGKRGEALEVLKPCREQGCSTEDFYITFAEAAFADEKPEIGKAAIAEGAEKYPESARFARLMGEFHIKEGHIRSGISSLEAAIQTRPDYVEAYVLLAKALVMEGKLQDAAARLKEGIAKVGDNTELLMLLAGIYSDQKDYPSAEDTLRHAVTSDPTNDAAQLKLGMVVKAQGRNDEAAAILNVLEKKRALDFDGTVALAEAYLAMGDTSRAKDILARLHSENPDDVNGANAYGRALGASQEFAKAIDILNKAAEDAPNDAVSRFYLGDIFMAQKKFKEAIDAYSSAVKLNPDNYGYKLSLAVAYLALGTVDGETEAKNQLDAVLAAYARGDVQPEDQDAEAYLLRGRILFARDKYNLAMKDFEDALNRAPARRDILVEFGRSLFEMTRYDEAATYFKQVLEGDGLNPDANYYLGRIILRNGNTEIARSHLLAAVKRNPAKFPDAHRMLGLIYRDKKMNSLAQQSFKLFLKYTTDKTSAEAVEVLRMVDSNKR
jgi:tetratricopeptide (TPR) repeat protein